jgi:hypothetical protein
MSEQTPTLLFNKATGYYEGTLLVQVDPKIFKQVILSAIAEDESTDLTDAMATAIARLGNIMKWVGHPHAKVTPVSALPVVPVATPVKAKVKQVAQPTPKPKTQMELVKERIWEIAQHIPPYLWDEQCVTPTPTTEMPPQEDEAWESFHTWMKNKSIYNSLSLAEQWQRYRESIGRLRYDERQILKKLRDEWEQGNFILDPEATEQEQRYQESQQTKLAVKLEAVAEAVNGNKFR